MAFRMAMVGAEADVLRQVARRLARLRPESAFEGFSDPARALARVREVAPDILVTDAQMPGMTGLELVAAARAAVPDLAAIVVAAEVTPELLALVQARGNAELLRKPVPFETLLAAIDRAAARRASPQKGFSGRLRLPMLPDLIQTLALSRASASLRVQGWGQEEEETGWIWFLDGEIVHARRGGLSGPDAFFSLLALERGNFTSEPCAQPPERTIAARWEELLMDGLRRIDEDSRSAGPASIAPPVENCFPQEELRFLRQSLPAGEGDFVAVAFRPSLGRAAYVTGGKDAELEEWASALAATSTVLSRLSAETEGLFEEVREDAAIALSWSWPTDRVVLLCQALEGVYSVSRFRFRCASFHRAVCLASKSNGGPAPGGAPRGDV